MQKNKEDPPIESRGSEWTPLLSKLLMELRCGKVQSYSLENSLCLRNYTCKIYVMFHQHQFSMQSKLPRQNQSYHTTRLCTISVAYQRSAIGNRSLCLEEQPREVCQLKGSSPSCSHAAQQGDLKEGSLRLSYLWDKVVGLQSNYMQWKRCA